MVVTNHAKQRAKERCGINKKSTERIANKALENGIKHYECNGCLKKWVDKQYLSYGKANNIRLYGNNAYLFHNEILITILQIPNNLIKNVKQIKERK